MAIARVQSASANTGTSSTATSFTITFAAPTTSGNTVLVGIAGTTPTAYKVTSAHGIFCNINPGAVDVTGAPEYLRIFQGFMFGADTVITITTDLGTSSVATASAVAVEYSGALIQPDNIPAVSAASGVNAANTGNLANTNANALFVGVIGVKMQSTTQNAAWASNNVAPFSIVAQNTTNNGTTTTIDRAVVYLDAIVATATTRGANVNHGYGTNRYAGLLATFYQGTSAAAGGGIRTAGHGGLAA